jgi:Ca2+-binding RTX toxin-like protein
MFNTMLGSSNIDRIVGFSALDDRIYIDHTILAGMNTTGTLAASAFDTAALRTTDRIIFNTTTGALLFDSDGSGSAVAVQFATLYGGWVGTLSANNFVLF